MTYRSIWYPTWSQKAQGNLTQASFTRIPVLEYCFRSVQPPALLLFPPKYLPCPTPVSRSRLGETPRAPDLVTALLSDVLYSPLFPELCSWKTGPPN